MTGDALASVSTRATPQREKADDRQVRNAAGGYGFPVDDWTRVRRFLTLGVDGGTYYASDRELARENAEVVIRAAADPVSGVRLVGEIVSLSVSGRAPKVNPALFALAIAASSPSDEVRQVALAALPDVARTGTHLFLFAGYVEQFRGWGRGLRRAVGRWYVGRDVDRLGYQVVKYRQRNGWTHRDLLRLAHPQTSYENRKALFDWVCGRTPPPPLPNVVEAYRLAQSTTAPESWRELAAADYGLPWEAFPDAALRHPEVWHALIDTGNGLPQTALLRQLPRLTRLGVLEDSDVRARVCGQLADPDRLRAGRVHPVNVLTALRTYASGHGARGQAEWTPHPKVIDALDDAFYAAFGAVEPAGRRTLVGLDVSASMGWNTLGGVLSCREAAAALAMVTLATEPDVTVLGFTHGVKELPISAKQRLDDVVAYTERLPFGRTDCALPMLWALEHRRPVDTFVVVTDNETWYGDVHPHQALARYRERMGIPARLVVVAMTATRVSIADPLDPGTLDVAGFDAAAPQLVADFSRGDV